MAGAVIGGVVWLLTLIVLSALCVGRACKRRAARQRGGGRFCMQCSYSLEGITESRCPECGRDLQRRHAVKIDGEPTRWSRRGRLVVLALVVWYPLVGAAYLIHVNEALHVWFCRQSTMTLSQPPSKRYHEVTIASEWVDLGVWTSGRAEVRLAVDPGVQAVAPGNPAMPLSVDLPSMRARYSVKGESLPRECDRLDAPFLLEWMREQGVDIDPPPPPLKPESTSKRKVPPKYGRKQTNIKDEAEAIRKEIERHDTGVVRSTAHSTGSDVFLSYSVGPGMWSFWTPRWYWPVAILLMVIIWIVLAGLFAPRDRSVRHTHSPVMNDGRDSKTIDL